MQYSVQTVKVKASVEGGNSYFIKGSMGEFLGKPKQDLGNPLTKPLTYYPVYLQFYFCKRKLA